MSKTSIKLFMGKLEINRNSSTLDYQQGPFIKGSIPFHAIKGFTYEATKKSDMYTLIIYWQPDGTSRVKKRLLTAVEPGIDEFFDELNRAIGNNNADLRGLSKKEIAERLNISFMLNTTEKTVIYMNIIITVIVVAIGLYCVKKIRYISNTPPQRVTIQQLISSPDSFDGKKVLVKGYVLPGLGMKIRHFHRRGVSTSYEGEAAIVSSNWSPNKPVRVFIHTDDESEMWRLIKSRNLLKRHILGIFNAGSEPSESTIETYKKAGIKVASIVGVIDYPPSTLAYWVVMLVSIFIWAILLGVGIKMVKNTRMGKSS